MRTLDLLTQHDLYNPLSLDEIRAPKICGSDGETTLVWQSRSLL
jgi:hypothetical protein